MRTLVIILAQGQQPHLDLPISKAMLPLLVRRNGAVDLAPFAAVTRDDLHPDALARPRSMLVAPHVTIIERTLAQLALLEQRGEVGELGSCVVAHNIILHELANSPVLDLGPCKEWSRSGPNGGWMRTRWYGGPARRRSIRGLSFAYPRSSGLHGVADTLSVLTSDGDIPYHREESDLKIVVLFGDTIYSWRVLRQLLEISQRGGRGFVVSAAWSQDEGDVWGAAWSAVHDKVMTDALTRALRAYPAIDDAYQGSQLWRWLVALRAPEKIADVTYAPDFSYAALPGDYTHDVDAPEDVDRLPALAVTALIDDRMQGLVYEGA